jgi:hypothetical protein
VKVPVLVEVTTRLPFMVTAPVPILRLNAPPVAKSAFQIIALFEVQVPAALAPEFRPPPLIVNVPLPNMVPLELAATKIPLLSVTPPVNVFPALDKTTCAELAPLILIAPFPDTKPLMKNRLVVPDPFWLVISSGLELFTAIAAVMLADPVVCLRTELPPLLSKFNEPVPVPALRVVVPPLKVKLPTVLTASPPSELKSVIALVPEGEIVTMSPAASGPPAAGDPVQFVFTLQLPAVVFQT